MYEYTPYTSELLDSGFSTITDLSSFTGINDLPSFPNGKQVIFFTIGIICVVGSLSIMSRALIADSLPEIAKIAKVAL